VLEREPLERLAADGELMAYRHEGFWQPMDTLREKEMLESLWASGQRSVETSPVTTFWRDRNVFVTGASGLLGSWLEELVRRGARDLPGARLGAREPTHGVEHALARPRRARRSRGLPAAPARAERVRGRHGLPPRRADDRRHGLAFGAVHVRVEHPGHVELLEAAAACGKLIQRVIVASSDKAYGATRRCRTRRMRRSRDASPTTCRSPARPHHVLVLPHLRLPVAVTRCGNLFGGGDLNFNRLIPGTIRSALLDEAPVIRSDGTFIRDYFYVRDAVDAYLGGREVGVEQRIHPGRRASRDHRLVHGLPRRRPGACGASGHGGADDPGRLSKGFMRFAKLGPVAGAYVIMEPEQLSRRAGILRARLVRQRAGGSRVWISTRCAQASIAFSRKEGHTARDALPASRRMPGGQDRAVHRAGPSSTPSWT
jgi:CDP-glucose 4,6-dehydratase